MDILGWVVVAVIAVGVIRWAIRRRDRVDEPEDLVPDRAYALERERQRAMAVEAAVRAGGPDQPTTSL
jgi:hypothetical protein